MASKVGTTRPRSIGPFPSGLGIGVGGFTVLPSLPAEMRTESQEESLEGRVDCENSMHVRIEKEHIMCAYISVYHILYI